MENDENKNHNFVQLNKTYLRNWRELARMSPVACEIMFFFMEKMGKQNNAVVCSYKVLEEVTGVSRASIGRAIKTLKDRNWVDSVKIGNVTAYAVNERIAWQSTAKGRKYAMFTATVVATSTDQEKGYKFNDEHPLKYIAVIGENETVVVDNSEDLPPPDQLELNI